MCIRDRTPFVVYDIWINGLILPTREGWLAIVYLGAFSTVLAYYWFTIGIEKLGATAASSYIFLVPLFGILGGWWLLEENLGYSKGLNYGVKQAKTKYVLCLVADVIFERSTFLTIEEICNQILNFQVFESIFQHHHLQVDQPLLLLCDQDYEQFQELGALFHALAHFLY